MDWSNLWDSKQEKGGKKIKVHLRWCHGCVVIKTPNNDYKCSLIWNKLSSETPVNLPPWLVWQASNRLLIQIVWQFPISFHVLLSDGVGFASGTPLGHCQAAWLDWERKKQASGWICEWMFHRTLSKLSILGSQDSVSLLPPPPFFLSWNKGFGLQLPQRGKKDPSEQSKRAV